MKKDCVKCNGSKYITIKVGDERVARKCDCVIDVEFDQFVEDLRSCK